MDLKVIQKEIYQNKINKGFNVTDVEKEFCLLYGEVAEAYEAYRKRTNSVGEELADVVIFALGIAEILDIDLKDEILEKMARNQKREYQKIDGVTTRIKEV